MDIHWGSFQFFFTKNKLQKTKQNKKNLSLKTSFSEHTSYAILIKVSIESTS
jgi:hypothetical protein